MRIKNYKYKNIINKLNNNKGSLAIESVIIIAAFLFPLTILIILSGILISTKSDVDNAARDVAREVSITEGTDKVDLIANKDFSSNKYCSNTHIARADINFNNNIASAHVECIVNIFGFTYGYKSDFDSPLNRYENRKK